MLKTDLREDLITTDDILHTLYQFQDDEEMHSHKSFVALEEETDVIYYIDGICHIIGKPTDYAEIELPAILGSLKPYFNYDALILSDDNFNETLGSFTNLKIKTGDIPFFLCKDENDNVEGLINHFENSNDSVVLADIELKLLLPKGFKVLSCKNQDVEISILALSF